MSLLSALYTGVSGLQSFGDSLQVIGDNIANVNTVAFKSSRAEFSDLLSQSINASSGNSQMGRGVSIETVSPNFTQGSFSNTDRMTDLAINGNGFFIVNDGQRDYYTRNGQFTLNTAGELVTADGLNLQGIPFDATGNPEETDELVPLNISKADALPRATGDGSSSNTGVSISMNLSASDPLNATFDLTQPAATSNFSTTINVYDSLGEGHPIQVYFNKTSDNNWEWHSVIDEGELKTGTAGTNFAGSDGTLVFDTDGTLKTMTTNTVMFDFTGTPQEIGYSFGDPTDVSGGTGLAGTTQFAYPNIVNSQSQDGFSAGHLMNVSINSEGVLTGTFSNGRTMGIGQIMLANFTNLQGLRRSEGVYVNTVESGEAITRQPGVGGFGSITSNSLELSNVDLATEFVNLISTQRAYQANSKIITIGDHLLSEIVNIVR